MAHEINNPQDITPVRLRSHICLNLKSGIRLTASAKREDYFPIGYNHNEMGDVHSALYAITDWNAPCENAVISNCVFISASKAISVGYMHSIVRNVLIQNVTVKKSNQAFVSMCHPRTGQASRATSSIRPRGRRTTRFPGRDVDLEEIR